MRKTHRVSATRLLLVMLAMTFPAGPACAESGSGGVNAPEHLDKPYVVILSVDGFRWDFQSLAHTPALDRVAREGIKADALEPVFPTLTFPNHFSIATGVLPSRHGVVANVYPDESRQHWYDYKNRDTVQDGSWYLVDPFWVSAEQAGMVTAAYFFVGTEARISGVQPTHWYPFNPEDSDRSRVRQVLDWLALPKERRPHLVTLYTEIVDDHTHWSGPGSAESIAAIEEFDGHLQYLLDGIDSLPHGEQVTLLIVSDHGQATYSENIPPLVLDGLVDLEGITVVEGGPYVSLFFDAGEPERMLAIRDRISASWNCGQALLREDFPPQWRTSSSPRFPDLLVLADPGCGVMTSKDKAHKLTAGDHGWTPAMPEMDGIFMAIGPRIPSGARPGRVSVLDVYPLVMEILGLTAPHDIDGDPERLPPLLLPVP